MRTLILGGTVFLGRLPWWVRRIGEGGRVPAPGDPGRAVQLIDARDLASWMLDLGEQRVAGAFNGTAPAGRTTMARCWRRRWRPPGRAPSSTSGGPSTDLAR